MQLIPVLFLCTVIALDHAIQAAKIPKPSPPSVTQNENYKPNYRLPEERRRLSLFPKIGKKFMVTTPSIEETNKPVKYGTKKPLMRKIAVQNWKKDREHVTEATSNEPVINEVKPKINSQFHEKKAKVNSYKHTEVIRIPEKSTETFVNYNKFVNRDETLQADESKDQKAVAGPKNKDDLIKPIEVENPVEKDVEADRGEYIFLKPSDKMEDKDIVTTDEPEEFVTTEEYLEDPISRPKRSDNIIEEENLGTTISGYKFTWKDTRLTNSLVYNNINS